MLMKSAADYLRGVYSAVKPNHVVEIGADPPMRLIAQTSAGIQRFSVVDFKDANDYRGDWFDMHNGMGIAVERVDGDARFLDRLIQSADIVYAHQVLFSAEGGADIDRIIAYGRGELQLSDEAINQLRKGFQDSEKAALQASMRLAPRVVWFTNGNDAEIADFARNELQVAQTKVTSMVGEDPEDILKVYDFCRK